MGTALMTAALQKILLTAKHMLVGKVDIVEGCVAICKERAGLDDSLRDDEAFSPFIALDSDLDSYPLGAASWVALHQRNGVQPHFLHL